MRLDRTALLIGTLSVSLLANAVFVSAYYVNIRADRPGATATVADMAFHIAQTDPGQFAAMGDQMKLNLAAGWVAYSAGILMDCSVHHRGVGNDFNIAINNLSGALSERKHLGQATRVVDRIANAWPERVFRWKKPDRRPLSGGLKASSETCRRATAGDARLATCMTRSSMRHSRGWYRRSRPGRCIAAVGRLPAARRLRSWRLSWPLRMGGRGAS